mmetsp:Transcript_19323/g.53740  ORF Transcript_19323/g.53740 Transcript_19323/m.53740 type:complete len:111 (-) Transcript_19323:161-493(-)
MHGGAQFAGGLGALQAAPRRGSAAARDAIQGVLRGISSCVARVGRLGCIAFRQRVLELMVEVGYTTPLRICAKIPAMLSASTLTDSVQSLLQRKSSTMQMRNKQSDYSAP